MLLAQARAVDSPLCHQHIDVVHRADPDEWCVIVNGLQVLAFSGPSAWAKALSHKAELLELLTSPDAPPAAPRPPAR